MGRKTSFFLGANTPRGFYPLYERYIAEKGGSFLHVKAGPGCGKSTFIRTVLDLVDDERSEVILCSGDVKSLDGVYFPSHGVGIIDATAPHITEPAYFGISGRYVDLGRFLSCRPLRADAEEIRSLADKYRAAYKGAYSLLGRAGEVLASSRMAPGDRTMYSLSRKSRSAAEKFFPADGSGTGKSEYRFLSARTGDGRLSLTDTVSSLAETVHICESELGLSGIFFEMLRSLASSRGVDSIAALSPDDPDEIEALIFPSLSLAFVQSSTIAPYHGAGSVCLRLDEAAQDDVSEREREENSLSLMSAGTLFHRAHARLRLAKSLHDELEAIYNPYVDFDGIELLAAETAEEIRKEQGAK